MTRYPAGHKARTRRRIVETAAALLRRKGVSGTGIGSVMREAGLTHGGFYGHFDSKDDLVADACAAGVREATRSLLDAASAVPPSGRMRAILSAYLTAHRRDQGTCTLATLGGELARQPPAIRAELTDALRGSVEEIAGMLPGASAEARADQALALIAQMVGAMVLARIVSDRGLSDRVLDVARCTTPRVARDD